MIGMLIFGGLAGIIAWAVRDKHTGVGNNMGAADFVEARTPPGLPGPPIQPEEERLLALLTLWLKDKRFPPGKKRFMTRALAVEAAKLAAQLGLPATASALLKDGHLPHGERMGRRGITVKQAILIYNGKDI